MDLGAVELVAVDGVDQSQSEEVHAITVTDWIERSANCADLGAERGLNPQNPYRWLRARASRSRVPLAAGWV